MPNLRFFSILFVLNVFCSILVFGQDYSRYKNIQFTEPRENPAYLAVNGIGGGRAEFPATNRRYVFPLSLVSFIPLEGAVLEKLNIAERTKDGYIILL